MARDNGSRRNEYRDGFVIGVHMGVRKVRYRVDGDVAVFEGDIVLGTVEEMEAVRQAVANPTFDPRRAAVVSSTGRRWPNGMIPVRIASGLPRRERVEEALERLEASTVLRFRRRTNEQSFVTFRRAGACRSRVGMRGGEQFVDVSDDCDVGNIVHEICHAAGLWHEHGREDRDEHVRIHLVNIVPGARAEFNQHITDGTDVGPYDLGSIMHYPPDAFSRNSRPTITPRRALPGGVVMGQRERLSEGDIAALHFLYGDG